MRPEEIAGTILRRWWIIMAALAVAAVVGFIGTSSQPKTYTASVRIMAIADPPDYWLDLYAKNRLASYKDLIANWQFVADSLEAAGSAVEPGVAQSKLTLGHNPDSNIVQIVATDTDPVRAAEIVNALADGFVERNERDNQRILDRPRPVTSTLPGIITMLKLDAPTPPSVASGPRVKVNTLAAGILGALAGLIVVFATIYFDDTFRRPADIERYLGLPLLTSLRPISTAGIESSASRQRGGDS